MLQCVSSVCTKCQNLISKYFFCLSVQLFPWKLIINVYFVNWVHDPLSYQYFWTHLTYLACIKTITLNRLLYFISNWLFISIQITCSQNQFGWDQLYSCLGSFNPIFCLYFFPFLNTTCKRKSEGIMKIVMGTEGLCGDRRFLKCSFSSKSPQ